MRRKFCNQLLPGLLMPIRLRVFLILAFFMASDLFAEPPTKKEEDFRRVAEAQRAAVTYAESLGIQALSGRHALEMLLGDGYFCGFRQVLKDSAPVLFCSRGKPPVKDCAAVDLYIFPTWSDGTKPFSDLLNQLENASVQDVKAYCMVKLSD
jgi:hypothetical protein